MEPLDYTALQEFYGGKHVAFQNDQVIASADTLGQVIRLIKEKDQNLEEVVFEFIMPKGAFCPFYILESKIGDGAPLQI